MLDAKRVQDDVISAYLKLTVGSVQTEMGGKTQMHKTTLDDDGKHVQ